MQRVFVGWEKGSDSVSVRRELCHTHSWWVGVNESQLNTDLGWLPGLVTDLFNENAATYKNGQSSRWQVQWSILADNATWWLNTNNLLFYTFYMMRPEKKNKGQKHSRSQFETIQSNSHKKWPCKRTHHNTGCLLLMELEISATWDPKIAALR